LLKNKNVEGWIQQEIFKRINLFAKAHTISYWVDRILPVRNWQSFWIRLSR
jgi:hypothetical protein